MEIRANARVNASVNAGVNASVNAGVSVARDVAGACAVGLGIGLVWEAVVRGFGVPSYLLPAPSAIVTALFSEAPKYFAALWETAKVTAAALALAVVSGILFAAAVTRTRFLERSVLPFSVLLQTTPIVAIAPLLIIWLKNDTFLAMTLCAWLACVFPVIASTAAGLRAADPNLVRLFRLYGASSGQILLRVRFPSALPHILNGIRIAGGLALIGAVGAEFVAGSGGRGAGLAHLVLLAGYNFQVPRLFAGLFLIALFGLFLYGVLALLAGAVHRRWGPSTPSSDTR